MYEIAMFNHAIKFQMICLEKQLFIKQFWEQ